MTCSGLDCWKPDLISVAQLELFCDFSVQCNIFIAKISDWKIVDPHSSYVVSELDIHRQTALAYLEKFKWCYWYFTEYLNTGG